MPIQYRIDPAYGIAWIEIVGSARFSDVATLYGRMKRDPAYRAGMSLVIDERRRVGAAETEDVRGIAKAVSGGKLDFEGVRCAVLVAGDAQYGMSRMFAALSEKSGMEVSVFRDEEEAVSWLQGVAPASGAL